MALKLMYITNNEDIAKVAENSGVDWIFVDLEINGKEERQGHLDTVISRHNIEDVKKIKGVLTKSKLIVRVNPIYNGSKEEIDKVIDYGADIVMLPFFKNREDVEMFIKYIDGRAKACLLLETPEAVENIDSILMVDGIDYIHIGLNDLHLGYNKRFMFELLTDGTVEMLSQKITEENILFGFGGVARLGQGLLPAEDILIEHYRLKSSMTILSRTFCNSVEDINEIENVFRTGVNDIRNFENKLMVQSMEYFESNKNAIDEKISGIVEIIKRKGERTC